MHGEPGMNSNEIQSATKRLRPNIVPRQSSANAESDPIDVFSSLSTNFASWRCNALRARWGDQPIRTQ
jgi:hypothetical protein